MPRVKGVSAEETRSKLLGAARTLFVSHGFSGASIGQIATLAGINRSLIFHHFGNKEGLWTAVKLQVVEEAKAHLDTLPTVDQPFSHFLHALLKNNLRFYRENPDIVRMISWQRLEYDAVAGTAFSKSRETDRWVSAFNHYQETGDINKKYDCRYVLTMIISIASSAAMDPIAFIKTDKAKRDYFSFVVECIVNALG